MKGLWTANKKLEVGLGPDKSGSATVGEGKDKTGSGTTGSSERTYSAVLGRDRCGKEEWGPELVGPKVYRYGRRGRCDSREDVSTVEGMIVPKQGPYRRRTFRGGERESSVDLLTGQW